jgi:DNA-directed RNA polymerase specialized sigma subunit
VSEPRISQLHSRAIGQLKSKLTAERNAEAA